MNRNLNTALLLVSSYIKPELDSDDEVLTHVEKLERVLLDEVENDKKRKKELQNLESRLEATTRKLKLLEDTRTRHRNIRHGSAC